MATENLNNSTNAKIMGLEMVDRTFRRDKPEVGSRCWIKLCFEDVLCVNRSLLESLYISGKDPSTTSVSLKTHSELSHSRL